MEPTTPKAGAVDASNGDDERGARAAVSEPAVSAGLQLGHLDPHVILDTMVDAVVIMDDTGAIRIVNAACERLFGYSRAELVGRNVKILMPSPYRDAHDRFVSNYLSTGERKIIGIGREVAGQRKDGTTFPMDLAVGHGNSPEGRFFIGVIRDVTERKRTERLIEERKAELAAIIETAVDGIIIIDSAGTIREYNPACERMFGFLRADAIGNNINMLMPSPYYDGHDVYLRNYQATRKRKIIGIGRQLTGRRKNGATFPLELSVGEIERNGTSLFVGILRDISERKAAEAAIVESRRAAEQASLAKSELLARVSHELRTPLNAILGFSEMMKLRTLGPIPDRYAEYAADIHAAARHLYELVNDLLDLSRIESRAYALTETTTTVADIAREALTFFHSANGRGVDISVELPADLPGIRVDPRMIRQVLINLIGNAVRAAGAVGAGGAGGRIRLTAQRSPQGAVEVFVTDNGHGIEPARLAQIFEPFSQRQAYLAGERQGAGLGLPISKALIELHGGTIRIESTPGEGTTVHFTLPASRTIMGASD